MVCGDSHTATHGAFGALAFGIGTSEVEHVLATQCLLQNKPKTYQVRVDGALKPGVTAKDIILALIARIGIGGGTGCVFEYCGSAIRALSMEERMTVCNMSIEAGARAGLIAPDDTTYQYLCRPSARAEGRGLGRQRWRAGAQLPTDDGAAYDQEHRDRRLGARADDHFRHQSRHGHPDHRRGSRSERHRRSAGARFTARKALRYMDLAPGKPLLGHPVNVVFIGSCTNSRISDLRNAAASI